MMASTLRIIGNATLAASLRAAVAIALSLAAVGADAGGEPFSEGRLWRVTRAGVPESFVFGTIHIADHRVSAIPQPVEQALGRSRVFAMELVPQAADAQIFDDEQFAEADRRLEPLIGKTAFEQLRRQLVAEGTPENVIERLKPWAAMMKVTFVAPEGAETSLDERLFRLASARRMRVMSLESIAEQISAFDAIPLDSQVALLAHTLANRRALLDSVEPTIQAWLHGDLGSLARTGNRFERDSPGIGRHYRQLEKHLIDDRTVLMHYRLALPMRAGGVFVAIGAAHLFGHEGLLALLERDGYHVTRLW